jgi:hypothetical protein
MGNDLRSTTKSEDERETTVRQMGIMLDSQPALVPLGGKELLGFIRHAAAWDEELKSCSSPDSVAGSVQEALTAVTKRREVRRRFFFFRSNYRIPDSLLHLDRTNLRRVHLDSADLRRFNFEHSCLWGASLKYALLDSARFGNARLDSARLEFTQGTAPRFSKASLTGASLNSAVLPLVTFRGARLACATFAGATLDSADFPFAHIEWTSFDEAHLPRLANGMRIDSTAVAGAFVRTAVMDPGLRAWMYSHGADSTSRSVSDWAEAKKAQWKSKGRCVASLREI